MFGFAQHRRQLLESELRRIAAELPRLGVDRAYLAGALAGGTVGPEDDLELLLVMETAEPYRRRADFFTNHLRPRVGTRFHVYTQAEFDRFEAEDPLIGEALRSGREVQGGG